MAVGTFPWANWRASDRSRRIAVFIVAPPCDGATMLRAGGHRQDGESRGLTLEVLHKELPKARWARRLVSSSGASRTIRETWHCRVSGHSPGLYGSRMVEGTSESAFESKREEPKSCRVSSPG